MASQSLRFGPSLVGDEIPLTSDTENTKFLNYDTSIHVWPYPSSITRTGANVSYTIQNWKDFSFRINVNNDVMNQAITRYRKYIFTKDLASTPCPSCVKGLEIHIANPNQPLDIKSNETYSLEINPTKEFFQLRADSVWGALRGLETFSQLVEMENVYIIKTSNLLIRDTPRFGWRGLMIDTSRHFLDLKTILDSVEIMSWNKFNILHWHIVDHESFPLQVKSFPLMAEKGAYSKIAQYSPDDIKKVVAFAHLRGIRVIPEFDCPGHAESWGRGYDITVKCPEYVRRSPFRNNIALNPGKPQVYEILDGIVKEAIQVFPDQHYHFGADEVRKDCWAEDKHLAAWMKQMNYNNFDQVLDFFEKRLEVIYRKYGKNMIAWQELLLNQNVYPVPKDVIIQTWTHPNQLVRVVKKGYKTILSAGWYLDYTIPTGGIRRHLWVYNWMDYYLNEPFVNQTYTQKEKALILGGEVSAWGEVVDNMVFEERLWPRSSAVAERLWSPRAINSTKLAQKRLTNFRCNILVRRGVRATPIEPDYCRYNYEK